MATVPRNHAGADAAAAPKSGQATRSQETLVSSTAWDSASVGDSISQAAEMSFSAWGSRGRDVANANGVPEDTIGFKLGVHWSVGV